MRKNNPNAGVTFGSVKPIQAPIKLKPRCMVKSRTGQHQAAVSNRGHLIPCCWLDEKQTMDHPIMQELLKVSKISEVENKLAAIPFLSDISLFNSSDLLANSSAFSICPN